MRALLASLLVIPLLAGCGSRIEGPRQLPDDEFGSDTTGGIDPDDVDRRPYTEDERAQSGDKLGGAWVKCYQSFLPSDDPVADLTKLSGACGRALGLEPVAPMREGERQGEQDPAERFTFQTRAGRCYRVFAVGSPEVKDLDVAVLDPKGRLAAADLSRDRFPVVPPRGPLCVEGEGVYSVEVAVTRGAGPYLLQVWAQ